MPYDNAYNRMIAREINARDRAYVQRKAFSNEIDIQHGNAAHSSYHEYTGFGHFLPPPRPNSLVDVHIDQYSHNYCSDSEDEDESEKSEESEKADESGSESDVEYTRDDIMEAARFAKLSDEQCQKLEKYLDEIEEDGEELDGKGLMDWVKKTASKVGNFLEEKIKPLASKILPLIAMHPKAGAAINIIKNAAASIPFVGADVKEKLGEYGLGKSGGRSGWVTHVKDYAAKHGISYKQALKDSRATYRKLGGASTQLKGVDLRKLTDIRGPDTLGLLNGVPARAPGMQKPTGEDYQGSSLGAGGVLFGPSNDPVNHPRITDFHNNNQPYIEKQAKTKEYSEAYEEKLARVRAQAEAIKLGDPNKNLFPDAIKDGRAPDLFQKSPPNLQAGPEKKAAGRSLKEINKRSRSLKEIKTVNSGSPNLRTGSAIFAQKGSLPLATRQALPPTVEQAREESYTPPDMKTSGLGKAKSKWAMHVRAYAAKHGLTYKQAIKPARASY